jgi:hypothetical protein
VTIYLTEEQHKTIMAQLQNHGSTVTTDHQSFVPSGIVNFAGQAGSTTAERASMNITLFGGHSDERSVWIGAHGYMDTACEDNYVSHKFLERSDKDEIARTNFLGRYEPVENFDPVSYSGHKLEPKHKIRLQWYFGYKSITRYTWFYVVDTEADLVDILIGHELIDELNAAAGGSVMAVGKPWRSTSKLPTL